LNWSLLNFNVDAFESEINNTKINFDFQQHSTMVQEALGAILKENSEITTVVFEKRKYRYKNLKLVPYMINIQQMEVLVQSILKFKYNKNVYYLNSDQVGKQNELFIGRERVFSSKAVEKMIKNKDHKFKISKDSAIFNNFLIKNNSSGIKEQLAKSFLLAFSFYNHLESIKNKDDNN
jgi:hypothetical protein